MFYPYRHASSFWHYLSAATLGLFTVLFGGVALTFWLAAIGEEEWYVSFAIGCGFAPFAVFFGAWAWKGWRGTHRLAAARRAHAEGQQRYGIVVDVFEIRSLRFDPLGDQEQRIPRQSISGARTRWYAKRPWLHVQTDDGVNYWLPTFLLSKADRGEVFRVCGVR